MILKIRKKKKIEVLVVDKWIFNLIELFILIFIFFFFSMFLHLKLYKY
jgi:hypothetical protein